MSDSVTWRPPPSGISSACQVGERLGAAERADRLVAAAELGAAAGHVDIGRAQRAVDVAGGDAERIQPVGVELDLDLARRRRRSGRRGATPFRPCSLRMTVSSTNQDSSSIVMAGAETA